VFVWILPYTVVAWSSVLYERMVPVVEITTESGPPRGKAVM